MQECQYYARMQMQHKLAALTASGLAAAWMAGLAAQSPSPVSAAPAGPPPVMLPLASLVPEAVVPLGGARRMVAAAEAVWVLDLDAGTVARVETKDNTVGAPAAVAEAPCAAPLVAFGSVWVADCSGPALVRIPLDHEKPAEVLTATIRDAGALASGAGSVWMVVGETGAVLRVDPDTNRAVADLPVHHGARALVFAEESLWVASASGRVTRVNGQTNVAQAHVTVGGGPLAVAAGEGAVWVLNTADATVSRIDPKTNAVVATITVGVTTTDGALAAGEGGVWVSAPGSPLVRIDPARNQVTHVFTGPGGGVVTLGAGSVWLTASDAEIWRVDPRRVEATRGEQVERVGQVAPDGVWRGGV